MPEISCPHCKNPIYDQEATHCHFCGESLGRIGGGKGMMTAMIGLAVVLAIILLFCFLFFRPS